uniref:Uncharacterized protein n=1 Tax=Helianthus annuus TaxID=4232 RepID=A0A251RZK0_HELAN
MYPHLCIHVLVACTHGLKDLILILRKKEGLVRTNDKYKGLVVCLSIGLLYVKVVFV